MKANITTTWTTDKGRDLITLDGTRAKLELYTANIEELRELALACEAAATALELVEETKTRETAA